MKPWSYDASELNPKDIPSTYIYKNQTIEEYLQPHSHERKLFLIGAKGCGKTLLLRYKAYLYWNKMEADEEQEYKISASNELVESLDFDIDTLSRNELENLASLQTWKNIWKFSLTLVVLRRLRVKLPSDLYLLDKEFPSHYRLSNIVTRLITNQKKYITSNFFRTHLNSMSALLNGLKYPFILFIDRLDQALDALLSNEDYKYHDSINGNHVPFKVWQYAQCGLLVSSYNFTTATNRHIKIFATARKEALDVDSQLMANVTGFCTYLEYTKEELKEIFEKNVKNTPREFLNQTAAPTNPYKKFFGFEEMQHVQAKDENQEFQVENVFDFLLRHTFERPREVILIGKLIYEQLLTRKYHKLSVEKKIEKVRRIVNKAAHETILSNYLKEVIPAFRDEYIDVCAQEFEQNLIYREELERVDGNIIDYLYRIGLIGYVKQNKQIFLPASKYIHDYSESIQMATYYMLHPSLDHRLQQKRDFHDFYNEYNIIGNGYPFKNPPLYTPRENTNKDVHYYLPHQIPGKGTQNECWRSAKVYVKPEKLYTRYFIEEKDGERLAQSQKVINDAMKILTTIANLTAIRLLRKRFNLSDAWSEWETSLRNKLSSFKRNYKYSKQITDIDYSSLDLFEGRFFGRLIAAGILIYLDSDYTDVHQLLRYFFINRQKGADHEESAVRFLRQAFFLAYLPNSRPAHPNERVALLRGLSDFEQKMLKRWWLQYHEHVLLEKTYFNSEQISYLKKLMRLEH